VDPERFTDDAQEPMSKKGMGVIYTHSHDGRPIRRDLTETDRHRLLDEYYHQHHDHLETMVEEKLTADSKCLIIDCHSFPGKEWLTERCVKLFENTGFKTVVNKPFSGSLVPGKYYRSNKNVLSVMIEVSRKLYLDESSALKDENFGNIQKSLTDVLESLQ